MVFLAAWTRVQRTGVLCAFVESRVTHAVSELMNVSSWNKSLEQIYCETDAPLVLSLQKTLGDNC